MQIHDIFRPDSYLSCSQLLLPQYISRTKRLSWNFKRAHRLILQCCSVVFYQVLEQLMQALCRGLRARFP
jgi:hypothetical protein